MTDGQTSKLFPAFLRVLRGAVAAAVFAGLGFVGASDWTWPRGWIYVAVFVVTSIIGSIIIQWANPGLLEARAKGYRKKDTKPFDRLFYLLFIPLLFVYPIFAGLDAVRLMWSPLPQWTIWPGALLFVVSSILTTWTMSVNHFAEGTVRIQEDRSQTVVTTGPYSIVRHPMYLGIIIGLPATALMLGSGWALVPAALIIALFIWRTAQEDKTLRRELAGYDDFTKLMRYRLFPGVW
jgi:protein-S-isoprenylcysteine O-methyltransferase Ste14